MSTGSRSAAAGQALSGYVPSYTSNRNTGEAYMARRGWGRQETDDSEANSISFHGSSWAFFFLQFIYVWIQIILINTKKLHSSNTKKRRFFLHSIRMIYLFPKSLFWFKNCDIRPSGKIFRNFRNRWIYISIFVLLVVLLVIAIIIIILFAAGGKLLINVTSTTNILLITVIGRGSEDSNVYASSTVNPIVGTLIPPVIQPTQLTIQPIITRGIRISRACLIWFRSK